jgi:septal ring factor EnvC (AmiA/AmiB activator)
LLLTIVVKIDPSKERLTEALALLDDYEKTIENLNNELAETQGHLESAMKDIDWHDHEKKRLLDNSSFQGETFESAGHLVKAMESERIELLKQLEAARGQAGLANGSVERLQAMLNHEKQASAALRKRQELSSLQDQVQAAHETTETERQINSELRLEIRSLRDEMAEMSTESAAARAAVKAEEQLFNAERQKNEALKDELQTLEAKYRDAVLAHMKAEEDRNAAQRSTSPQMAHSSPDGYDTSHPRFSGTQSDTAADRPFPNLAGTSPGLQSAHEERSAAGPSGFRTIHGTHRPDGTLGGWRKGRKASGGFLPVKQHNDLYGSSIEEEPVIGRRPLNPQSSSYSDATSASATSSNDAT